MPSEIFYKPVNANCEDGKVRSVRVKCYRYNGSFASDTVFSVPAHVRIGGKYITGYVGSDDAGLYFRAHARMLPRLPAGFKE